jgi:hypothetical protein
MNPGTPKVAGLPPVPARPATPGKACISARQDLAPADAPVGLLNEIRGDATGLAANEQSSMILQMANSFASGIKLEGRILCAFRHCLACA